MPDILRSLEPHHIVEAFPRSHGAAAGGAAERVSGVLTPVQYTVRIEFSVDGEKVLIPDRFRFLPGSLVPQPRDEIGQMECAIHSRSLDGYQRQAAVRAMIPSLQAWSAPFILFVMGEWIAEILEDLEKGLTEDGVKILAQCANANPIFWRTTKSRVQSYFHVYQTRIYKRENYPGFRLVDRIEAFRSGA